MAKRRTKAERAALSLKMKAVWAAKRAGKDPKQGPTGTIAFVEPGYETLAHELGEAFAQSAHGKGRERHQRNGRSFDRQPILELGRLYGPGFCAGQAAKKTQEALGMLSRGERERALFEVHGAIVYLAATAALLREGS